MNSRIALLCSTCLLLLPAWDAGAAVQVGVTAAVNQSAEGDAPGASRRTLTLGDSVIHNEHIVTGPDGLVNILLIDGTSFTVGANSDLTIDSFVYDPDAGTAQVAATLTKGALRFIGGRTSKTGGATINTPVGAVGVRGGMTDIILNQTGQVDSSVPENLVNCVYGACSVGNTTFSAGQSVYPDGSGGYTVVDTSPEMAAVGTNQIGSRSTQKGGANVDEKDVDKKAGSTDGTGDDGDTNKSSKTGDSTAGDADDTTILTFKQTLRILTSPSSYLTSGGVLIPTGSGNNNNKPAQSGLVGSGTSDQNVVITFSPTATPRLFSGQGTYGAPNVGTVTLPGYNDQTYTIHGIGGASSPFGTLNGTAYSRTGFAFYELFYNVPGDSFPHPFYALSGAPTDFPTVFTGDGVRRYAFTVDPIQNVPVPFFRSGVLDFSNPSNLAVSDFYTVDSPSIGTGAAPGQDVRMLQAWLQISGTGLNQQSGIGVTDGDFVHLPSDPLNDASPLGNTLGFRSDRQGSYRSSATDSATLLYGPLTTVPGPGGGNEVFGPTGTNFVLSTNIAKDDTFGDDPADPTLFNTVHVANLVSDTAPSTAQSTRTLTGFGTGMVENALAGVGYSVVPTFSASSSGVSVSFDAPSNTLAGNIGVNDAFGTSFLSALHVAFGGLGNAAQGNSVYIDDNMFAASSSATPANTFATTDAGQSLVLLQNQSPGTYFVSSDAVALNYATAPFMNGAQICACSFIEWGWWGSRPDLAGTSTAADPSLTQSVHLGTWVVGDIVPNYATLPLTGTATYTGQVVGTVLNVGFVGDSAPYADPTYGQYVAGGSARLTWDFGSDSGNIAISFDGRTFGGIVSKPGAATNGIFTGDVFGAQLAGTVNGAIVRSSTSTNAGIIGDFGIYGLNYSATGIIVAGNINNASATTTLPTLALPLRVLTSGANYTPFGDQNAVSDPGAHGLVGNGAGTGESGHDQLASLVLNAGHTAGDGTIGATAFHLPIYLSNDFASHAVTAGQAWLGSTGNPLTGTAYSGAGEFAAYLLTDNSGDPFYAITGIPTTIVPGVGNTVFEGGGVRAYDLTADAIQGVPVPFMRADAAFTWNSASYASTPLYVVNADASDASFSPHVLQSWLTIQGTGTAQVSGVGVSVSTIFNNANDGLGFGTAGGRRGSYRDDASQGSVTLGGVYSTLGGPNPGANQFFGPNAENFVIGTGGDAIGDGSQAAAAFYDFSLDGDAVPAGQGTFGTVHVATLDDTPVTVGTRTARTLTGFATGVVDVLHEGGCASPGEDCTDYTASKELASGGPGTGGIAITFTPSDDAVSGTISLGGVTPAGDGSLAIGFGGSGSRSTFIDDNYYAAREPTATTANTGSVGGGTLQQRTDGIANTYLVAGSAVPIAGYQICASCSFIEWGWWGTQVPFAAAPSSDDSVYMAVHLGSWVAGNIVPNYASLGTTGTATYTGGVIGSVISINQNDAIDPYSPIQSQYVASGVVSLTWNFAQSSGNIAITFDGRTFGGIVDRPGNPTAALFAGNLTGSQLLGSVNGAIVSSSTSTNAGIIGNFNVAGVNYYATGILGGANTGSGSTALPQIVLPVRVLTAGAFYTPTYDDGVQNPGHVGLVGNGEAETGNDTTVNVTFAFPNGSGNSTGTGSLDASTLTLPILFTASSSSAGITTSYGTDTLSGTAYYGPGEFAAYLLHYDGEGPFDPLYAITGIPTTIIPGTDNRLRRRRRPRL